MTSRGWERPDHAHVFNRIWYHLVTLCLCFIAMPSPSATAQAPFDVQVHADRGVLGQVVPVTVAVSNNTSDLLVITSLQLRYRDRIIIPGGIPLFTSLQIRPRE